MTDSLTVVYDSPRGVQTFSFDVTDMDDDWAEGTGPNGEECAFDDGGFTYGSEAETTYIPMSRVYRAVVTREL